MYLQSCHLGHPAWRNLDLVFTRRQRQPEVGSVGDETGRLAVDQYPEWLCIGSQGTTPVQVNSISFLSGYASRCKCRPLGVAAYAEYEQGDAKEQEGVM